MGEEGQTFVVKGRLQTLSSASESRKFKHLKIRNRNVHIGCIVPCPYNNGFRQYISAWAIELLILVRGNARAQMRDRRSRAPTSFRLITTNR